MKGFVLVLTAMLGGCATLDQMISHEFRYGQYYMLEDVMLNASNECNEDNVFTAKNVSRNVIGTLHDHKRHLNGIEREKADDLYKQLNVSMWNSTGADCSLFGDTAKATRQLLNVLS